MRARRINERGSRRTKDKIFIHASLLLVFLTSLCILFQMPAVFAQEETEEIVAAVPLNFPPQYMVNKGTGQPEGFAIDVMDTVAKRSGLRVRYVVYDTWPDAFDAFRAGDADVIPNLGITSEREEYIDFTSSVEAFHISIFVRSSTSDIEGIDGLAGRRVAVVEDNKGMFIMQEWGKADLKIYNSMEEAFLALLSGDVDALVYPEPTVFQRATQSGLEGRIKTAGEPLLEVKRAIGVQKGDAELLALLDAAVKDFVKTPEYMEMYVKWYGEPEPYWNAGRVAAVMGIILALTLAAFAIWRYWSLMNFNRKLKESEARYRSLFDGSPDGIFLADPETGKILDVNPSASKLTKKSVEELVGLHQSELHPPSSEKYSKETFKRHVKEAKQNREVHPIELLVLCSDGTKIPVEVMAQMVSIGGKEVIQGVFRNITERKEAAEKLLRVNRALKMLSECSEALGAR